MGCAFRIVLYADSRKHGEQAAAAAFERVAQLEACMSDYDGSSELLRLCATAVADTPHAVSADLWQLLRRARTVEVWSAGAFDVTVGPLSVLWRRARFLGELPRPRRIAAVLPRVGYEKLRLHSSQPQVTFAIADMRLDLGGIAKGYAIDQAAQVLKNAGLTHFLVDGGGDLLLGAPPPTRAGWRVEVQQHSRPRRYELHSCAIATSGDRFRHLDVDNVRHSHLIDPRSGHALTQRRAVTVIAADATLADALASALSILGPDALAELTEFSAEASLEVAPESVDRSTQGAASLHFSTPSFPVEVTPEAGRKK